VRGDVESKFLRHDSKLGPTTREQEQQEGGHQRTPHQSINGYLLDNTHKMCASQQPVSYKEENKKRGTTRRKKSIRKRERDEE